MPGAPDLDLPPSIDHVRNAFAALARFHLRLNHHQRNEPSPGLRLRFRELQELAGCGFDRLESVPAASPPDDLIAPARRWLALARTALPRILPLATAPAGLAVPVQPCLRDARPEHFLFVENRLTGLIDFGAMDFETVSGDLARLLGEWLPDLPELRATALLAYEQLRPLSSTEKALLAPFETIADLLIAGHWITWHFLDHRTFETPDAVARGISRGLVRLERLEQQLRDDPKGPVLHL